jgi:hypothetical protein
LKIMWDLSSAAVSSAVSGMLDIDDGGVKRRIPLDGRQVRFGSVLYTPKSEEVSVDLTALKEDGSAGQASVLVLLSKSWEGRTTAAAVRNVPIPGQADRLAGGPEVKPSPIATRTFVAPASPATPRPSVEVESLPTAQLRTPALGSVPLPPPTAPAVSAPKPAAPPPVEVAAPAPRPERAAPVAEPITPAKLVSEAGARLPAELRSFQRQPVSVTVRAIVDETGRVVHAETGTQKVPHVGFLNAAIDAAMHCRFTPARRGNTPIRSEAVITFHIQ